MADQEQGQLLEIRFTVNPETVPITQDEMNTIQNAIAQELMQIVQNHNYGTFDWLEVGGYAKWAKA